MATVKTKKRMMYTVFVFIFIFGGIEYAVILPTLWLYLHTTYDSPEYMLGLVLSAYSVAALFSSPIFGRISDRVKCTKQIFLICSTFELLGSFLYFVGISQWLCVGSRFISGLGAASEAIALAEVSRYTTEKERTGIISNLVASRQIALLLGPGLNLFLRIANFKIGIFDVNKFSSPGAFMVIMWAFLMLVIVTMYTEPKLIYAEEDIENRQKLMQENSVPSAVNNGPSNKITGNSDLKLPGHEEVTGNSDLKLPGHEEVTGNSDLKLPGHEEEGILANGICYKDQYVTTIKDSLDIAQAALAESNHQMVEDLQASGEASEFIFPPLSQVTLNQPSKHRKSPFPSDTSDYSETSRDFHDTRPPTRSSEDSCGTITNENQMEEENKIELSCSVDLLISAERIINSSHWLTTSLPQSEYWSKGELYFHEDHFGQSEDTAETDKRSPLLGRQSAISRSSSRLLRSCNDPYIERSISALDDPIAREGKMGFFCNEYIRDEIIAIVCILFCAMFSQVCVETMVLPLTLKYLDFDELDNSLLYCACGFEILIVFIIMSRLSRCISDRVLMLFGIFMLLASNIWLLWYLPKAPPHSFGQNLPFFTIAVFLDILSLPFLLVCSTSLYSKLTRKETAGLSQGLRRGVVGLGTIIAPLWGSSAVSQPYILLGVLVALQALSMVLCLLSFKRLKVPTVCTTTNIVSPSASPTRLASSRSSSRQYNTNSNTANIQVPFLRSAHSTPYGSIQRSYEGSSYHSVSSFVEPGTLRHHSDSVLT